MEEGIEIHSRAQSLHPNGVFAGNTERTQELLESATDVIFEAAFEAGSYTARADWIRRDGDGWLVGEVKSSLDKEDGPPDDLIDDMAYTVSVLRRAGLEVIGAELIQLNKDWRLGMPDTYLFIASDATEFVEERAEEFDGVWDSVGKALAGEEKPMATLCSVCKGCEFFGDGCIGEDMDHPVFILPRMRADKIDAFIADGVTTIEQVRDGTRLSLHQRATVKAIQSGEAVVVQAELRKSLSEIEWPVAYLDFETVKTAIPLWSGVAPHEQVVSQYSVHVYEDFGVETDHRAYLAQPERDCRRDLVIRLIEDLADAGSIVVYSSFEKTMIRGLAERFPDYARELQDIEDRLFDLEPVVRNGYIHPEFGGRTSIKVVVPVLAPDLSYEGLEIGDGDTAVAAFAAMAKGKMEKSEMMSLREALLAYCKIDTLAMVRVHQALMRFRDL